MSIQLRLSIEDHNTFITGVLPFLIMSRIFMSFEQEREQKPFTATITNEILLLDTMHIDLMQLERHHTGECFLAKHAASLADIAVHFDTMAIELGAIKKRLLTHSAHVLPVIVLLVAFQTPRRRKGLIAIIARVIRIVLVHVNHQLFHSLKLLITNNTPNTFLSQQVWHQNLFGRVSKFQAMHKLQMLFHLAQIGNSFQTQIALHVRDVDFQQRFQFQHAHLPRDRFLQMARRVVSQLDHVREGLRAIEATVFGPSATEKTHVRVQ